MKGCLLSKKCDCTISALIQKLGIRVVESRVSVDQAGHREAIMCGTLLVTTKERRPVFKTRVRNMTDRPVDIQIRAGSMLIKAYRVKPGCCKMLSSRKIYSSCPAHSGNKTSNIYNWNWEPYVWIHSPTHAAKYVMPPMAAKQQYVSVDDLRECTEMKICLDGDKGTFYVVKLFEN